MKYVARSTPTSTIPLLGPPVLVHGTRHAVCFMRDLDVDMLCA